MKKFQRYGSLVICFLMILQLFTVVLPVSAEYITAGDYEYYHTASVPNTVVIYKYNGSDRELVIPSKLNGRAVSAIGARAFKGNSTLEKVVIPDGVVSIGYESFANCSALTSIDIAETTEYVSDDAFLSSAYYNDESNWQDGVFYVGAHLVDSKEDIAGEISVREGTKYVSPSAFYNRSSLTSVTLPDSVVYIGACAFSKCYALRQVKFSENLKTLCASAFEACPALTEIKLPNSLIKISDKAFYECKALKTVELGNAVEKLEAAVFYNCTALETVNFPQSLTYIGAWCFQDCSALKNISLPQSVTDICRSAFEGTGYYNDPASWTGQALYIDDVLVQVKTTAVGTFVIKDGTRMLARNTFLSCQQLDAITIPEGVSVIGASAFEGCKQLKTLSLPNSVKELGFAMCRQCSALESVSIPSHITQIPGYAFLDCVSLKECTISKKVKHIGNSAFRNCDSLRLVYIPKSVKTIDAFAFYNCDNLRHVLYGGSRKAWFDGVSYQAVDENVKIHRATKKTLVIQTDNFMFCKKCQSTIFGQQAQGQFTDVNFGAWYHANGAVDYAYNLGIFKGVSETTFEPNANITRGMFVAVLGRLHGVDSKGSKTQFTDVKRGAYYAGAVSWAVKNGIVKGTSDTTFAPDAFITREQICAMLYRYCSFADIQIKQLDKPIAFTDASEISFYAKKAVTACQQGGIISGKGANRFEPVANATRAEVATILMNFCENYL